MSTTGKLLRAFIEAQGYEIKRVRTGDEKCDCYKSNPLSRDYLIGCQRCQGTGVSHGIFDYKVTKRVAISVDMRKEFPDEKTT